ncbi:MAG: hypothetical protein ACTSXL_02230 [Alphaproteobacteria bacterium]
MKKIITTLALMIIVATTFAQNVQINYEGGDHIGEKKYKAITTLPTPSGNILSIGYCSNPFKGDNWKFTMEGVEVDKTDTLYSSAVNGDTLIVTKNLQSLKIFVSNERTAQTEQINFDEMFSYSYFFNLSDEIKVAEEIIKKKSIKIKKNRILPKRNKRKKRKKNKGSLCPAYGTSGKPRKKPFLSDLKNFFRSR